MVTLLKAALSSSPVLSLKSGHRQFSHESDQRSSCCSISMLHAGCTPLYSHCTDIHRYHDALDRPDFICIAGVMLDTPQNYKRLVLALSFKQQSDYYIREDRATREQKGYPWLGQLERACAT